MRFLCVISILLSLLGIQLNKSTDELHGKWILKQVSFNGDSYFVDSVHSRYEKIEPYIYFGNTDKNEFNAFGDFISYFDSSDSVIGFRQMIGPSMTVFSYKKKRNSISIKNFYSEEYKFFDTVRFGAFRELNGEFMFSVKNNQLSFTNDSIAFIFDEDSVFEKTVFSKVKCAKVEFDQGLVGKWNLVRLEISDSLYNDLEQKIEGIVKRMRKIKMHNTFRPKIQERNKKTFLNELQLLINSGGWLVNIDREFVDEFNLPKEHNYGHRISYNNGCNSCGGFLNIEEGKFKIIGGVTTLVFCPSNFKGNLLDYSAFKESSYQFKNDTLVIRNPVGSVYYFLEVKD